MFDIKEELKKLPDSPGVYIMHDKDDNIIYVGKAINLKNRVSQYFRKNNNHSDKIKKMVSLVSWFEYIVVENELEALILENNLIKKNMPKYNTLLKDDKTYPYIKLTNEEYPRLTIVRDVKKDGANYYGPFANVKAVNEIIQLLNNTYKLRSCEYKKLPEKGCIYMQLGQCIGPCVNKNNEDYSERVKSVKTFFSGNYSEIIRENKELMKKASEEMEFEKAVKYRDIIKSIEYIFNKQRMTRANDEDIDVISINKIKDYEVVIILFVRDGKIVDRLHYFLDNTAENSLESFIYQYYSTTSFIPKKIVVNEELENSAILSYLSERRGNKVSIIFPKKGKDLNLLKLAEDNAKAVVNQNILKMKNPNEKNKKAIKELKDILKIEKLERIESYDISNTSGSLNVASLVVFDKGEFKKNDYRKFRLMTDGPNDYACMQEVIKRRFTDDKFKVMPDILLIDGGKGQVNAVLEVLNSLGVNITVCGMVKDDNHKTRGIYFNGKEYELKDSFNFVTRIQDETHRFAINYHRKLRSENMVKSILDDIPGVGPVKKKALYENIKNIDDIKEYSIEQLEGIDKIDFRTANNIYEHFHKK